MSALEIVATAGFVLVISLLLVRPQLGIIALIAFYPLLDLVPRLPLSGVNAETAMFGIAGAVTLMRFGARLPPLRYSGPWLAFAIVMLMSWLIGASLTRDLPGVDTWEQFKAWKSAVFPCLFFLFAYWWVSEERTRRQALEAMTWSVAVIAISALVDAVAPFTTSGLTGRPAGVLGHPNTVGGLLGAFSLAALPLIRSRELGLLRRAAYLAVYLIALAALMLTLSRGGWLGVVFGHAVVLLVAQPRLFLAALLAGAILLPSSYPLLPEVVRERVESTFRPQNQVFRGGAERFGAGAERIVFYRIGLDMFLDSPIWGHGMGSFLVRAPEYGARYGLLSHFAPHSLIVSLASEAGVLGLAMLLWIGVVVTRVGLALRTRASEARWLGLTLLGVLASISASNLVHDSFLGHHVVGGLFWMLFGAAARAHLATRQGASDHVEPAAVPLPRWLAGRELLYAPSTLARRDPTTSA